MATRLKLAKQKLIRLNRELNAHAEVSYNHIMQANGQPMNDKRGGYRFLAKAEANDMKGISLMNEFKAQVLFNSLPVPSIKSVFK